MQCTCGGETYPSSHEVKGKDKADEWVKNTLDAIALPVTIKQDRCPCGRFTYEVFDANKNKIYSQ